MNPLNAICNNLTHLSRTVLLFFTLFAAAIAWCAGGPIVPGQVNSNSQTYTIYGGVQGGNGNLTDVYTFTALAGNVIYISMSNTSIYPDSTGSTIELDNPDGTVLKSVSGSGTALILQQGLQVSGTYSIKCNVTAHSYTSGATVGYNMAYQNCPSLSSCTITPGYMQTGNTTSQLQVDSYNFTANAGDVISTVMGKANGSSIAPRFILIAPDGTQIADVSNGTAATDLGRRLSQTGLYWISCMDLGLIRTGSYNLLVRKHPGANEQSVISGTPVSGTITPENIDTYTFTGHYGDTISMSMTKTNSSDSLTPYVRVYNPDGSLLAQLTNPASINGQPLLQTGQYWVDCLDANYTGIGAYTLSLSQTIGPPSPTVSSSASPVNSCPGGKVTYTLNYANTGGQDATNVSLTDTLPAGMTYVTGSAAGGASYNASTNTLSWSLGTVNCGATAQSVSFQAMVNSSTAVGTQLWNSANITCAGISTHGSSSSLVTVNTPPALVLGETASPTTPYPGEKVMYTLTYQNTGGVNATNVTLTDPLPAGVTYVANSATGSGSYDTSTNTLTWSLGTVNYGAAARSVSFQATVNSSMTGGTQISNIAGISATEVQTPVTRNAAITVTVPSLTLTASALPTNPLPGGQVSYTLTYANTGGLNATNVTLTDPLPATLTYVANSATHGGSYNASTNTLTWSLGTVNIGTTAQTVSFQVTVNNTTSPGTQISNTASIAGTELPIPVTGTSTVTVETPALTLTATASPTTSYPGGQVSYTLTYANTGGLNASNTTLTDTLPTGLAYVANSATSGGSYNASTHTLTWSLGTVNYGATAQSVSFQANVNNTTAIGTQISNSASICCTEAPAPVAGTALLAIAAPPALTVTNTASPTNPSPGATVTYTLTYTNTGSLTATNVTVSDTLPAGLTYVANSATNSGSYNANTNSLAWSLGTMNAGASPQSVSFQATVNNSVTAGTQISNTAGIACTEVPTAVTSTAIISVTIPTFTLTNTASPMNPSPGSKVIYTLAYANTGSTNATNVTLSNAMPAGLTYVANSATGGGSFNASTNTLSWSLGTVNAGATAQSVSFMATVGSATAVGTQISNSASISCTGITAPVASTPSIVTVTSAAHPADTNGDNRITIAEVTAYGSAWKHGTSWPNVPSPIPASYVTNAGHIWRQGEVYTFDSTQAAPACWAPTADKAASTRNGGANGQAVVRTLSSKVTSGQPVTITLQVTPPTGTSCYAIEDTPPAGWMITNITVGGNVLPSRGVVQCGPFLTAQPRTLTYTITPPATIRTGSYPVSGTASFDGHDQPLTTDTITVTGNMGRGKR